MMAIGAAAAAALDLLSALAPAKAPPPKPTTGVTQAPGTFGALLASLAPAQTLSSSSSAANRADSLKDLFVRIDGNGDSQISKSEFRTALGANGSGIAATDSVFAKLDIGGDGSVSLDELAFALNAGAHHRDGSTSLSYADGTTLTMNSPAGAPARLSASSHVASSYHLVDQAAERRMQDLSAGARQSLSLRV